MAGSDNEIPQRQGFPRRPGDTALEGFAAALVPGSPISIVLSGEHWGPKTGDIIASLKSGLELDFLSVRGAVIGDQGMMALVKCPALSSIRYLGLERCGVTNTGVDLLLRSGPFGRLKNLSLCNREGIETGPLNTIDDVGAIALASSRELPVLEEIELWKTEVGDSGFTAIANSTWLPELATVYAWGTKLTRAGANLIKDIAAEKSRARQAAGIKPFRWTSYHTDFDDRVISWSDEPG
jgi:hypothetical protein